MFILFNLRIILKKFLHNNGPKNKFKIIYFSFLYSNGYQYRKMKTRKKKTDDINRKNSFEKFFFILEST